MTPYLSVCSCLGYDAPYLYEWLEFHRLVGVERFFLYNNGDREVQREMLAPYVEEGIVELHDWRVFPAPQMPAFRDCIVRHKHDSRWIGFIDTDEFLFSPTGRPMPDVLRDYERWSGVGVCRAFFGPSGHKQKPDGLVIESYRRRLTKHKGSGFVKSIIDPPRAVRAMNPHWFRFEDRMPTVDENGEPVNEQYAKAVTFEKLRINHYWTRSEEEWAQKSARLRPDTGTDYREDWTPEHMRSLDLETGELDDTIQPLVPPLKEALEQRLQRSKA